MQSVWRVACVRIPRFPIGAVWRAERGGPLSAQLQLPLEELSGATPAEATSADAMHPRADTEAVYPGGTPNPVDARSLARDGAPNRSMDGRAARRAPFGLPGVALARGDESPVRLPSGRREVPASGFTAGHWDAHPIALASDRRLRAVSAAAGRAGVRAGMGEPEARARCAALEVMEWDELAVGREITRATAAFLEASPQVTPVAGAPGCWWIGAHGFEGLGGERALAFTLRRIARRWHPRARVAIADSCVAARAATWASDGEARAGIFIVPPGGCAAYLALAPLALLPMDPEMRETLSALGMRTIGALAALEPLEVERRWGNTGIEAWRLARGDDRRRPVLERPEGRRVVEVELPAPVTTMEPVLFLVRPALERLLAALVSEGRAAAAVAVTLTLDRPTSALPAGARAHTVTREVRPAHPLGRIAPLFDRCRSVLERWMLEAPVCGVTVAIAATAPLSGEQGSLLDGAWRDPAAVDAAFAKLRDELGIGSVVRPMARDDHPPERQGTWKDIEEENGRRAVGASSLEETDERTTGALRAPDAAADHAALRLLEQPEPVEIEWGREAPSAFRWRGRRIALARATGPERLTGDWWKGRYRRDYWHCEEAADSDAGHFLVFVEKDGWFLQGWYD